jgi:hypothetical protein
VNSTGPSSANSTAVIDRVSCKNRRAQVLRADFGRSRDRMTGKNKQLHNPDRFNDRIAVMAENR